MIFSFYYASIVFSSNIAPDLDTITTLQEEMMAGQAERTEQMEKYENI